MTVGGLSVRLDWDVETLEFLDLSSAHWLRDDVGCRTDNHVAVPDRPPIVVEFARASTSRPHYGGVGRVDRLRGENLLDRLALGLGVGRSGETVVSPVVASADASRTFL